jgi:hypothetical protein
MPTFSPNKSFTLSGTNLNFVQGVSFGDQKVASFFHLGTTGISGNVPAAAMSGELFVETSTSLLNLGTINQVLDSSSQLVVGPLSGFNLSGEAGDIIQLTGTNFYQVDGVKFGDVSGEFYYISNNLIEAIVPPNADYGGVSVFSSSRTGANNDVSLSSGITSNNFIPIPEVTGLNSGQLVSGETLVLEGRSLSGVTGVSINNIESDNVALISSVKINVEVPSGDFRGVPNLLLESGASHSAPNYIQFKPLAEINSIVSNVATGSSTTISGKNFGADILYKTGDGYLVSLGGATGAFGLTSDTTMTGRVPRDLDISVSGGNIAAGVNPVISSGNVSVFSNSYPESYGSDVYFTPLIGSPEVSSISPSSGIGGDTITVKGFNLYAITGVDVNAVGVSTSTSAELITVGSSGRAVTFDFPIAAATISDDAELFNLTLSGVYGNIGVSNAFYTLGKPTITSNEPETDVLPGSSGTIIGTNLYSGTEIQVYNNAPNRFITTLTPSGYADDHSQLTYWYPNSFATGINYKLRVKNRRTFSSLRAFTTLNSPTISGFEPASGEFGESITVSGYFEGIVPSGLNIGNVVVDDFSQVGVGTTFPSTGITFTIPSPSVSDVIKIETSGGYIQSTGILGISENKPSLSGFYLGSGVRPETIYSDQVFSPGDLMTISGERMNLVTGVSFSGAVDPIVVSGFEFTQPNALALRVPDYINSGSGNFVLEDFRGRKTSSSTAVSVGGGVSTTNVDVVTISGFTNFLVPEATMSLSGNNVTGMSVVFVGPTGDSVTGSSLSNSVDAGVGSVNISVPHSIQVGNLSLTGRHNDAGVSLNSFYPLSVITGISGASPSLNVISTGANIILTGINSNFINAPERGQPFVGFSGSGHYDAITQIDIFPISTFNTGSGIGTAYPNIFYNEIGVDIGNQFIGTGKFFLLDEWDSYYRSNKDRGQDSWSEFVVGSGEEGIIKNKINFFNNEYSITGTRVLLSGFTPSRGITGSVIDVSGEGLRALNGVSFSQYGRDVHISTDVSGSADGSLLKVTVPCVTASVRGMVDLSFFGGAGGTLKDFEIIDDTSALEFNVVNPATATVPTASAGQVVEYTIEETVGGVVWYVTYKQYPDGTKAIVSSFPKP